MSAMRSVLLAVFVCACAAVAPVGAAAELGPTIDGTMQFQAIQGPDGPDEFAWEVQLNPGQELRQVDDQHAGVYYTDPGETLAFSIAAVAAHDSVGTTVPTTIAVTQPNIVTLTVHHREGSFLYPVSAGAGWEGGVATVTVEMPPAEQAAPLPTCTVPDLSGRTLRASRAILHRAHCKLGPVRGERSRAVHVVQQYRSAGKSLPTWTMVGVKVS